MVTPLGNILANYALPSFSLSLGQLYAKAIRIKYVGCELDLICGNST